MAEENKSRILCVDDDKQNLKLLEALLSPEGYLLQLFESGEDALRQIAAETPDIILLDIMMPKISGLEILKRLRSGENTRLIPVIVLTALQEEEDKIKSIEAGCDDFISKPFVKSEVIARVRALLKMSYYRRSLDEKEKIDTIISEIGEGIIVLNSDWSVQKINIAAVNYFNIADAKNINLPEYFFTNYTISISKEIFFDLSSLYKKFDIIREETEKSKALYLEVYMNILKNPAGEISSIALTFRDVTEQREEERLKQEFLSFISHKLRTPITIIKEDVSILRDEIIGPVNDKQKEIINIILKQLFLFTTLIEKLIKFIEITKALPLKVKETIGLQGYLKEFSSSFADKWKDKRIEFNIQCADMIEIRINKSLFNMVLENLAENAAKFNDNKIIKIGISVKEAENNLEVAVSDNGRGIPSEDREKIFQKFYQVEKNFTGQVEGIGLGLSLMKHIIEINKGSIEVKSEIGKGTTFIFILPKFLS